MRERERERERKSERERRRKELRKCPTHLVGIPAVKPLLFRTHLRCDQEPWYR
jgi:hypothetical protein